MPGAASCSAVTSPTKNFAAAAFAYWEYHSFSLTSSRVPSRKTSHHHPCLLLPNACVNHARLQCHRFSASPKLTTTWTLPSLIRLPSRHLQQGSYSCRSVCPAIQCSHPKSRTPPVIPTLQSPESRRLDSCTSRLGPCRDFDEASIDPYTESWEMLENAAFLAMPCQSTTLVTFCPDQTPIARAVTFAVELLISGLPTRWLNIHVWGCPHFSLIL